MRAGLRIGVLVLGLLVLAGAAAPAWACAVCYGDSEAPMTAGMNNAIVFLLAVVAVVQGGFVAMFLGFRRRARRLREERGRFQLIDGGAR